MLPRRTIAGDGMTRVEFSDDMSRYLASYLDRVAPTIRSAFEREAASIVRDARKLWPVKAYRSRRSIDKFLVQTKITPDAISTAIINGAPYAIYIKFSRYTRDELKQRKSTEKQRRYLERRFGFGAPRADLIMKSPWVELVRKPQRKAEKRLAEEVEADLLKLLER